MQFLQEGETNLVFRLEELTTAAAAVQQGEELENIGIGRECKMQIGERRERKERKMRWCRWRRNKETEARI